MAEYNISERLGCSPLGVGRKREKRRTRTGINIVKGIGNPIQCLKEVVVVDTLCVRSHALLLARDV